MHKVIHADKDRDDDHSGTSQPDALRATLESDRPTTPEEPQPTFPERKFGDPSLSLHTSGRTLSLRARSTVSRSHVWVTVKFPVSVHTEQRANTHSRMHD